jgi:hypothetical protein
LASASLTEVCALLSLACATATAAWDRVTWSCSRLVSSSASTWPLATRSFTSTRTFATVPDSSLPIATWVVGSSVPLAVTVTTSRPRAAGSVT